MKKNIMAVVVAGCMLFGSTAIVNAEETDYSYLEDMSVKELKALDAAIHEILGDNSEDDGDAEKQYSYSTELSKEELLELAIPLSEEDIQNYISMNQSYAENMVGNVYHFTGNVQDILSDHVEVSPSNKNKAYPGPFCIYLPSEILISLERFQDIEIVAKLTGISYSQNLYYGTTMIEYRFENAALI